MFLSNRLGVDAAQTAKVVQPDEGENLFAKTEHFTLIHAVNLVVRDASDFHDGRERVSEKTAADAEEQSLNTRKSEPRAELNRCFATFLRRNAYGALEAVNDGYNDNQADTTASYFPYTASHPH